MGKAAKMLKDWPACEKLLADLREKGDYDALMLFAIGLFTAFRVSDYRDITWDDLVGPDGKAKEKVTIREKKTAHIRKKKPRTVWLGPQLREIIELCFAHEEYARLAHGKVKVYVFRGKSRSSCEPASISNVAIWKRIRKTVFKYASEVAALQGISSHSLRKQFAHNAGDLLMANLLLGHSSIEVTKVYIGYDDSLMEEYYRTRC